MGFVQEKELRPLPYIHQPEAGMKTGPQQSRFVRSLQFGNYDLTPLLQPGKQVTQRTLLIIRECRVRVLHISIEHRRIFCLYPFQPGKEHGLITGQMGNIIERAPLSRCNIPAKCLFIEPCDELTDSLVLMLEPGEARCG